MVGIGEAIERLKALKRHLQAVNFIPNIPICEAIEMGIQALYEKAERKIKK
jgi:hypothetical protein